MARIITDAITTALLRFAEQFGPEIESQASQDVPALPQEAQAKAVSRVEARVSQESEECKVGATQFGQCGVEGHAEAAGTPRLYEQCSTQQVSSPATVHSLDSVDITSMPPERGVAIIREYLSMKADFINWPECYRDLAYGIERLQQQLDAAKARVAELEGINRVMHKFDSADIDRLRAELDAAVQRAEKAEADLKLHQEFHGAICLPNEVPESYASVRAERDTLRAEVARLREACQVAVDILKRAEPSLYVDTVAYHHALKAIQAALDEGKEAGK